MVISTSIKPRNQSSSVWRPIRWRARWNAWRGSCFTANGDIEGRYVARGSVTVRDALKEASDSGPSGAVQPTAASNAAVPLLPQVGQQRRSGLPSRQDPLGD